MGNALRMARERSVRPGGGSADLAASTNSATQIQFRVFTLVGELLATRTAVVPRNAAILCMAENACGAERVKYAPPILNAPKRYATPQEMGYRPSVLP